MSWDRIIRFVLSLPQGVNVVVPKTIPLPENAKPTLGEAGILSFGRVRDWEITLPDGKRIHIVELGDRYLVHWDSVSPLEDPLGHLMKDSPKWYELIKSILTVIKNRFF